MVKIAETPKNTAEIHDLGRAKVRVIKSDSDARFSLAMDRMSEETLLEAFEAGYRLGLAMAEKSE